MKNKKSSSASIATELKKLAELKEEGILSEAEFLEQKKKLLDIYKAEGALMMLIK